MQTNRDVLGSLNSLGQDTGTVQYINSVFFCGTVSGTVHTLLSHQVQVKDTLENPASRIPLVLTGEFTNENGESTPIDNGEAITQKTDIKGTSMFVINIPADVTAMDFRVSPTRS